MSKLNPFVGRIHALSDFRETNDLINNREEGVTFNLAFLDARCGESELEQLSALLREISPKVKLVAINSGYHEEGNSKISFDHYLPAGYSAKQVHYLIHLFLRGAEADPGQSNGNILILDDDESLLVLLQEHLLKLNYFVSTCSSEDEVWQHMKEHDYDVIVLDFHLPDTDGVEILKKMKKRYEHVFVVGMSSMATNEEIQEFMKLGAFTVMKKPLDLPHLGKIFKKFVYQSQHSEDPILAAQESNQKSGTRLPFIFLIFIVLLGLSLWLIDRVVEREGKLPQGSTLEIGQG